MTEDRAEYGEEGAQLRDYHDLGHLDKPTCLHCDREVGVVPGMGGLAFKCRKHGKFHTGEIEANAMDVMQRNMEEGKGPSLLDMIPIMLLLSLIALGRGIRNKAKGVYRRG